MNSTYLYVDFANLAKDPDPLSEQLLKKLDEFDRNRSQSIDTASESQDAIDSLCRTSSELRYKFLQVAERRRCGHSDVYPPSRRRELPFAVGDVVAQHRHTDDGVNFDRGSDPDKLGTFWRVLQISDERVRLELIGGRYGDEYPGHIASFSSSHNYQSAHPGCSGNEQILREFRKVDGE